MGYNSEFFGENVAVNNHLQLTEDGISLPAAYTLAKQDVTAEKVKITCNFSGNASEYFTINANETLLGKGKLVIEDLLQDPGIAFNYNEILSLNQYWDGNAALNFDTVIVDGEWKPFEQLAVTIDSIRPLSLRAGVGDTLTIYGNGFESTQGNIKVQLRNAHMGDMVINWINILPHDINYWSNNLIKIIIPTFAELENDGTISTENYAGTGKVRVYKNIFQYDISSEILEIRFALLNQNTQGITQPYNTSFQTKLIDDNQAGGYTIYFSNEFKSYFGASNAFNRALTKWRCNSGVNFKIVDSIYLENPTLHQRVSFDNSLPTGAVSTLASTSPSNLSCNSQQSPFNVVGTHIGSFSIKFNSNFDWHTSEDMPSSLPTNTKDLESVALHELGHAQGLLHSNQHNDLMYFTDLTPPYRRDIGAFDAEGSIYQVSVSTLPPPANTSCKPPLVKVPVEECMTTNIEESNFSKKILLAPNPTSGVLNIYFNTQESSTFLDIQFINLLGEVILLEKLNSNTIDISKLPQGIYFAKIRTGCGQELTQKILKL
ncbi:MAG: T9SS type A sorting domain-containing protein [Saprospiraceae bacterium]|nr:T9SS type A sorting domain-containing protein [Saprospiraceae bacterium]